METFLSVSPKCRPALFLNLVLFLLIGLIPSQSSHAFELLVGTGMPGTFSQFTGHALCRILARQNEDLSCTLISSDDELGTLTNVQGGSLDLALVDSQLLSESLSGEGSFKFLDISYEQLRMITPLYDIPIVFIVRPDANIDSHQQLAGKRINTGPPGSQVNNLIQIYLSAMGWTKDDFSLVTELSSSMYQDQIALSQGTIQAMVYRGVHPDSAIGQLLNLGQANLIGLDGDRVTEAITHYPGMSLQHLAEIGYREVPDPIYTFGTSMVLVTSADMDNETVTLVTRTLSENKAFFQAVHPSLSTFSINLQPELYGGLKVHEAVSEWILGQ